MTILLISDLHLEESTPDTTKLFVQFLQHAVSNADSLYILGDFFEAWIGDDNLTPFNQYIIEQLKLATQQGLPIYFMHGNRDFLIGKKFLRQTGCQLLADECVIDLYGVPTLLMHGDTLCTEDKAYLKFRKKAHNRFFQWLFLLKSLNTRRAIAERYREASKAYTSTSAAYIMDVTPTAVEQVMQKHHVQHLIHGHTHRPAVHDFAINGKPAVRTVLGPWHEGGSVLICKEDGSQQLRSISLLDHRFLK